MSKPIAQALHKSSTHTLAKSPQNEIELLRELGIVGDAHMGMKVKHRSRVAKDPTAPNLRQVHLINSELFDDLQQQGIVVLPGQMGENITTRGLDILNLPVNTILSIGTSRIRVTGLRNPCAQLDSIQPGLMSALIFKDEQGNIIRKAGIMAIVLESGTIITGDEINIEYPPTPHEPLKPV